MLQQRVQAMHKQSRAAYLPLLALLLGFQPLAVQGLHGRIVQPLQLLWIDGHLHIPFPSAPGMAHTSALSHGSLADEAAQMIWASRLWQIRA